MKTKYLDNMLPMSLWIEVNPVKKVPNLFEANLSHNGKDSMNVRQWHVIDIDDIKTHNIRFCELELTKRQLKIVKVGNDDGNMPENLCPWLSGQRLKDIGEMFVYTRSLSVFQTAPVDETKRIIDILSKELSENAINGVNSGPQASPVTSQISGMFDDERAENEYGHQEL